MLNSGAPTDNAKEIFERYKDFDIQIVRHAWGIKLEMHNAPASAFVDGEMIRGIKEHLFAVLRDVIYIANEIVASGRFDLTDSASITNAVFHILRNARLLDHKARPNLVVCWGGHSIERREYQYTKNVGYELGLRGLDVCTGCGPGAMKGPMKGATIGHAKQRIAHGRYIGITEPGIIAAEPPNPDRQAAGDHAGHREAPRGLRAHGARHRGVPGRRRHRRGDPLSARRCCWIRPTRASRCRWCSPGRATARPTSSTSVRFIEARSGARPCGASASSSMTRRRSRGAWCAAWSRCASSAAAAATPTTSTGCCRSGASSSMPFEVTHAAMRALNLQRAQPVHELAANLRRAFSGIVTGNVKEYGIQAIERLGPYELAGDPALMRLLDELLTAFVAQRRMSLPGSIYKPGLPPGRLKRLRAHALT